MSDSSIPPEDDFLDLDLDFGPVTEVTEPEPPLVDLPPIDESPFEDSQIKIGDGECIVCGAPTFRPPGLTATGRKKRAPKHCDLHAPNKRIQKDRSFPKGMDNQLQRVQDELADDIRLLGTLAGPMLPVTGLYLFEHADPFTIALLKLAKNNQAVLRVLHRAAQIAPIYTVAETVAGTAYSIQVDSGKADPHNTVGTRLGVAKVYDLIYNSDVTNVSSNGAPGPPTYASS